MKRKILVSLVLITILISLSLFSVTETQLSLQQKDFSYRKPGAKPPKPEKGPKDEGISTGVISQDPPPNDNRWAIIIGISDYDGEGSDLGYCDDDAWDMYYALTGKYDYLDGNIIMLIDNMATKEGILNAIEEIRNREDSDSEVVFFYSGHGTRSNYNVDSDKERKDEGIVTSELDVIWDGDLKDEFSDFDSTRIFFYFDTCYSGGMSDLAGDGRLIVMACGENHLSLESSAWENGQFTYYFVDQGILEGKANANPENGEVVTFEEAFDYADANCFRQDPTASDNFTNDMLP